MRLGHPFLYRTGRVVSVSTHSRFDIEVSIPCYAAPELSACMSVELGGAFQVAGCLTLLAANTRE